MSIHRLRIAFVVVLVLLPCTWLGAGFYLSRGKVLSARHLDIPDSLYDFSQGTYPDYINWATAHLGHIHQEAASAAIVANLSPFVLEPVSNCPRSEQGKWQRGIVLIHGLIDSPYSMRPFGEDLQQRCFYVLGLLLPDHGTRPGDLLDSRWEDWAAAAHFAAMQLGQHAETIFMSGHSAGGTLAILEAARNPAVAGLVLFTPALAIAPASKYARFIAPLGLLFPAAGWFEVKADAAVYRYESFSFRSGAETWDLIEATLAAVDDRVRALPTFTVASVQDNTVDTTVTLDYMAANTSALSRTVLYSQHDYPALERTIVVNSNNPDLGVLSVSHLGVMTPAAHPWYGRDGAYRNCGHYPEGSTEFTRCKSGQRDYYAEATAENRELGLIERIAWNPYYPEFLQSLDQFFNTLDPLQP